MSDSDNNSNDIAVPAQEMGDFFFMDADEEQEKYGATTKVPSTLLTGNVVKEANSQKVSSLPPLNLECLFRPTNSSKLWISKSEFSTSSQSM